MAGRREESLNLKYAALQGNYWMVYCAVFGYVSVFLLSRDFTAGSIGILTAAANVLAAVVQMGVAGYADRTDKYTLKDFILLFTAVGILPLALLILLPHMAAVTAGLYILVLTVVNVIMPLVNAISGYYESRGRSMNFGLARGIGSLSFAVVSYLLGYLIRQFGEDAILVTGMVLLCCMSMIVNTFRMRPGKEESPAGRDGEGGAGASSEGGAGASSEGGVTASCEGGVTASCEGGPGASCEGGAASCEGGTASFGENGGAFSEVVREPGIPRAAIPFYKKYSLFLGMLFGIALIFTFHNMVNTYLIQIMGQFGGDSVDMGLSIALAAVCELPAMFLFAWIVKRVPVNRLLIFSAFGYVVKAVVVFLAGGVLWVNFSQLFQSISFALYTPASVYYADAVMDLEDRVKGQAFVTAAVTLGGVAGNLAGGWIIDAAGVHAMLAAGVCCALAGFVIVCFTARAVEK